MQEFVGANKIEKLYLKPR